MVNYFPANAAWENMWSEWDPAGVSADFARIAGLHANAVRLSLFPYEFGFPTPTPAPAFTARVRQAVDLAAQMGLRVQFIVFDGWNNYADIAGSERWLRAVLAPYVGDRRIWSIELQDEISLTDPTAIPWLQRMIDVSHQIDPELPVTVSVSDSDGPAGISSLRQALAGAEPDFLTLNFYHGGHAEYAAAVFAAATNAAAGIPLYIGGTGYSTVADAAINGLPAGSEAAAAYQAHYLRAVDDAALQAGLPMPAPWTLNDFQMGAIPSNKAVSKQTREYHFGLSAASIESVGSIFASGAVQENFNNGFEQAVSTPTGPLPAEWRLSHPDQGSFAWDSSVSHTGQASARLSSTGGGASGVPAFFTSPIDAAVVPGRTYSMSAWVKGRAATGTTRVSIAWFDDGGQYLGQVDSAALPGGTTSWQQLTASGAAPTGAAFVQLHLHSSGNTGAVWFDDVCYHSGSSAALGCASEAPLPQAAAGPAVLSAPTVSAPLLPASAFAAPRGSAPMLVAAVSSPSAPTRPPKAKTAKRRSSRAVKRPAKRHEVRPCSRRSRGKRCARSARKRR